MLPRQDFPGSQSDHRTTIEMSGSGIRANKERKVKLELQRWKAERSENNQEVRRLMAENYSLKLKIRILLRRTVQTSQEDDMTELRQ